MKTFVIRLSTLVVVLIITSGMTWTSFVQSYADWRKLTPQAKVGYVLGAFDQQQHFNPMATNTVEMNYAIGVQQCVTTNGLTPALLVQLVDNYYAKNTDSWKSPASEILELGLFELCKEEINTALKKAGLEPIPDIPKSP